MAQERVRLGYVGAGRFSQSRLLPSFKRTPGVELVAICNSTEESSRRVAQEFGFQRVTKDWQEVVTASDVDAVVVGTHAPLHKDICLAALDADKPVLTLNAISATLEEAKVMYQKAQEKPHLLNLVYPGQFYLREDAFMRTLLEEGYVGLVLQAVVYWYTPYFGLGTQFEVARRWLGEHTRLFGYRKGFDVEIQTTEPNPTSARAATNAVLAELEGEGTITYLHSTIVRGTGPARFEVYGAEGALVCYSSDQNTRDPLGQAREGIYGAKAGEKELRPIPVPPPLQEAWTDPRGVPVEADFIAAVRGEKTPAPAIARFWDGVKLMEFIQAWRQSIDGGTWVDLPLP